MTANALLNHTHNPAATSWVASAQAPGCDFPIQNLPLCVFEATHGSAPKYKGLNRVNPTAMILSGALMLRHLGHPDAAERVADEVLAHAREVKARGAALHAEWEVAYAAWRTANPERAALLDRLTDDDVASRSETGESRVINRQRLGDGQDG